jgi:hypothetical protein
MAKTAEGYAPSKESLEHTTDSVFFLISPLIFWPPCLVGWVYWFFPSFSYKTRMRPLSFVYLFINILAYTVTDPLKNCKVFLMDILKLLGLAVSTVEEMGTKERQ